MRMKTVQTTWFDAVAMRADAKKQRLMVIGIMLIIFAVVLAAIGLIFRSDVEVYRDIEANGTPDFNYLTAEEFAELPYVSGNVELVLDYYAEEYETTNGVRRSDRSDKLYYLVSVSPIDAEGYYDHQYLITLEAAPYHFDVLDTICEETWAEEVPYEYTRFDIGTSKVTKMNSEIAGYLQEFSDEADLPAWLVAQRFFGDIGEEEAAERILPYVIVIGSEPLNPNVAPVCIAIAVALLILGIVLIVKGRQAVRPNRTNAFAEESEAVSAPTCPQCHAQLSETDSDFCPFCGRDLKA